MQNEMFEGNTEQDKAMLFGGIYEAKSHATLDLPMEKLYALQQCIKDCRACTLWGSYKCPVESDFSETSRVFVIGEAPGKDELATGKPFMGRAGKLLMDGLKTVGLSRNDLYISNVYHCRPLENKLPDNAPNFCHKFLKTEIKITKPSLILALGNTPLGFLKGQRGGITHLNGTSETLEVENIKTTVVYALHPSAALRNKENLVMFNSGIKKLKEVMI
jgi:DNA polymerase